MTGVESSFKLTYLNLSCNKIQNIVSLKLLQQLKVLVLSHNRIVNIKPLIDLGEYSKLETLDLTDNYVGELGQIKLLKIFRNLKHLSFRQLNNESQGSNPICDYDNYLVTCKMNCLSLKTLDGVATD